MQDGSNSILTNYFKVALFPSALFLKAVKLCESYEEGHLLPPSSAKQRQRRSISASAFNFLRGLNSQNVKHHEVIAGKLELWLETKARPTIEKVPNGKIIINVLSFLYIYVLDSAMHYFHGAPLLKGSFIFKQIAKKCKCNE